MTAPAPLPLPERLIAAADRYNGLITGRLLREAAAALAQLPLMGEPTTAQRRVAGDRVEEAICRFVEDYQYDDGDGGVHDPDEQQLTLILDAIRCLHADEHFVEMWDAWRALCDPAGIPRKGQSE